MRHTEQRRSEGMSVQDDVAGAREAVRTLERAVQALARHYGDSLDARRLKLDADRLSEDLELLCGREQAVAAAAPVRPLEVIEDRDYDHSFWMDAEDEGLGRSDFRRR
jgi:hypothetical protein